MCSITSIVTLSKEEAKMAGLQVEAKLGRKFTVEQWRFWEPFLRLFGPVEVLSVEDAVPEVLEIEVPRQAGQLLLGRKEMWR